MLGCLKMTLSKQWQNNGPLQGCKRLLNFVLRQIIDIDENHVGECTLGKLDDQMQHVCLKHHHG